MHDHRIRPAEGITQPSKVLVMMERVPTGPVEQLDVRICMALPVVRKFLTRMQQHVSDPSHRDKVVYAVAAGWQCRQRHG